jgi:TonB-linked SusC/RagA family outer membrane protein
MKTKFSRILTLLLAFIVQIGFAQEFRTITGTVTDEQDLPLPGVNIIIDGTSTGVQTDFDGNYTIQAQQGDVLVFSFVGMETARYTVGQNDTINVTMGADAAQLDEVVVTALGIRREKKSLGYATQEVDGSEVSDVPTTNFMNSLSGKVSGLKVQSTGTMGGSSDIVIRGNSSLTGNNQALFVIDGVPISNDTPNTGNQQSGRGGFDYGNLAADINPEDIASMNVLKGAAATALYGARAANGVIIIETKKGQRKQGLGISVNSSFMATNVDKTTFPKFQKEYGAGYGPFYPVDGYFMSYDINGDGNFETTTPFTEDVSYGARFDPNRLIYQWDAIYPQLDTYMQPRPWVAAENDPSTFFETGYTAINSVALDGGTDRSSFRLGFTNLSQTGNLPNSSIERNNLIFSATHDLTDRITLGTSMNYTKTDGVGRYGTGYQSENPMQQFRQWWQVNVDVQEQRRVYEETGQNITWNPNSPANLQPIYMDNPYWTRYENFNSDTRHRYFGNANINFEINEVFSLLGRFSFDSYYTLQEERRNVGSVGVSGYTRRNIEGHEFNTDIILNFNHDVADGINLDGNLGFNLRENRNAQISASTNGGLVIPSFYALSNTASPMNPPTEFESTQLVDGFYGRVSLGFFDTYFLEGTLRRDRSSTLPMDNNTFWYPSISTSVLLTNLIDADFLNYAKIRANYAEVGGDTSPYRVFNTFNVQPGFAGGGVGGNFFNRNNIALRPETAKSWEVGLEANMFDRRVTFDLSYYNTQTVDQITPVPISMATGFGNALLNAGTMENEGIEASLGLFPIRTEDFSWNVNINWARNRNRVVELIEGIDNLQLASLQGGVSINAAPGQPYGAIRGSDYVYDDNGNRMIHQTGASAGYYMRTPNSNQIIGNIQPDWVGGVSNRFQYKNVSFNFLIDVQKGGDVFSLDTWYGYGTGAYERHVGNNDLGNPLRNTLANGGGVVLDGVTPDGEVNTVRADASTYANPWGWGRDANKGHVYDASFVKLREASLTYAFTENMIASTPFTNASISLIGRNLWIIHKNIPHSDPEAGLSAGNIGGYQSGAYPAVREIGASLKINF